jgi:hypothetical protein
VKWPEFYTIRIIALKASRKWWRCCRSEALQWHLAPATILGGGEFQPRKHAAEDIVTPRGDGGWLLTLTVFDARAKNIGSRSIQAVCGWFSKLPGTVECSLIIHEMG